MTCNVSDTHLEVTWNLGGLYHGDNDATLWKDLEEARMRSLRFAAAQRGRIQKESLTSPRLGAAIQEYEAVHELVMKPYLYAYLWHSQDMRDPRREALLGRVRERRDEITLTLLFFCLELSAISEESLSRLAAHESLHKYAHVLDNLLPWKPYLLGEEEEGSIWETLYGERRRIQGSYDRLIGSLSVPVNVEGDAHSLSISQALACLRSPKRKLRANASFAFLRELGSREKEFGDVLRSLLRNYQQEREKRCLHYPEQTFDLVNEVDPVVMDAMTGAVESHYELGREYLRLKSRLLGLDRLKSSDILAPLLSKGSRLTFSEAYTLLLASLGSYHPLFRSILERLPSGGRIDATIRPGKFPGAFCKCFVPTQHPFISLPYEGNVSDLLTLTHEVGHALHYRFASNLSFLNFNPPPILSEFAGTFFEILFVQHLLDDAGSPLTDGELLAAHMDSIMTTVFRQHVISRFEKTLHSQGPWDALEVDDICHHWWKENTSLYGEAVEMSAEYRWGWSYIWHIFHKPFYCRSYVFGNLLSMAVYEIYREGGSHVLNDLIAIWSAGGSQAPLAMLQKMGINPSKSHLWDYAFRYVDRLLTRIKGIAGTDS